MQRPQFTSTLGTLLAMTGAAIGLGNVWRFPYMMASHGGSAFLLVYLAFVLFLAVPALACEWGLGRATRGGTIRAFCAGLGPVAGRVLGYALVFGILMANSYYLVVIGNLLYTAGFSVAHGFDDETLPVFSAGLGQGGTQFACSLLVLAAVVVVAWLGVRGGIERVSRTLVPLFFLVVCYLIYSTFMLEGAVGYMRAFMQPDFGQLSVTSVFAALGQAAFTVGLGGTLMVVYGSYIPDDTALLPTAGLTAMADTLAALMAALFIFPTLLVFGLSMDAGPGLLFQTLPRLFEQMAGGRLLGSLFLLALLLVAFLSALAALEVVIASISDDADRHGLTRRRAVILFGLVELALVAPPAFYPELISTLDLVFGSGMMAFGCLVALLVFGWLIDRGRAQDQLDWGGGRAWQRLLFHWSRTAVPLVIAVVLGSVLWDALAGG